MAHPRTSLRYVAAGLFVLLGLPGCEALYFDLDSVPLRQTDTSSSDADGRGTTPPPVDAADTTADTRTVADTRGDTTGDTDRRDTTSRDTHTKDTTGPRDTGTVDTGGFEQPQPAENCLAVASCAYLKCPALDRRCVDLSTAFGEPVPRQSARKILGCARENDCDYYFGERCLAATCPIASDKCLGSKPRGNLTCFEIVNCRRLCNGSNAGECQSRCRDDGSFEGRAEFGALQKCLRDKCSGRRVYPPDKCLREKCNIEFRECMGCR